MNKSSVTTIDDKGYLQVDWAKGLLPTQRRFFFSKATRKFYLGPVGSGKSVVLVRAFLSLLQRSPGNVGLIGRQTFKDFENSTLVTLNEHIAEARILHPGSQPSKGMLKIHSIDPVHPSTILFSHYDSQEQYGSVQAGVIAIDEICDVPREVYKFLETRLRLPGRKAYYILGAGNVMGKNWVWSEAHPASPNRKPDHQMFTPNPFENSENLPERYYDQLIERNGKEWVARFVYGSFEVFEGQIYPELIEKLHRKPNNYIPMPPPKRWPRIISLDHGLRNPTAVGFYCVNEDGEVFCYDEHYEAGKPVKYHAGIIKEKFEKHCKDADDVTWVADPSIFSKSQSRGNQMYSIYDEYEEHGLGDWMAGENDQEAGRNRIKEYLKGEKLFFLERCYHHYDELSRLHWRRPVGLVDTRTPEQQADVDDHTCLHGDTIVLTPQGGIPIRDLVDHDGMVLSPAGDWVPFRDCRMTRRDVLVVKVSFEDGREILCTPDHEFLCDDGRWVQAVDLTGVLVCDSISHLIKEKRCESRSSVLQSKSSMGGGTISAGSTSKEHSSWVARCTLRDFIASYGRSITDRFRRATTFTTAMTTGAITSARTSLYSWEAGIAPFIPQPPRLSSGPERIFASPYLLHRSGTGAPLEGAGTRRTTGGAPARSSVSGTERTVNSVAGPSWASTSLDFVVRLVRRLGGAIKGWTTKNGPVPFAEERSRSTNMLMRVHALAPAVVNSAVSLARVVNVECAGRADVFCLTVPGVGAFAVAGGIIVKNCDELRYALMTRPETPLRLVPKHVQTDPERRISRTKRLFKDAAREAVEEGHREIEKSVQPEGDYVL